MTTDQLLILLILSATVGMFLWGGWRHDMVALGGLLACVLTGLVPRTDAFAGFGHPAVITVACVLVLSRGLQTSGAIDALTQRVLPSSAGPITTIALLTGLGAFLSAFMNNIGALALLMPVAIQAANKHKLPPGRILMPLAFGSILGGMTTLIGTPPNLIVSGFRAATGAGHFGVFDFTPVGLSLALCGVLFITLVGWRLVPVRERAGAESFETGAYLTEARVTKDSKAAGRTLRELGEELEKADAQIVGFVRGEFRLAVPSPARKLRPDDILVIEAEPKSLATVLSQLGLKLVEDVPVPPPDKDTPSPVATTGATRRETGTAESKPRPQTIDSGDVALMELAVRPETDLINRSATDVLLRTRFGINLLALSRQGERSIRRLRSERFQAGDVLLVQGPPTSVMIFANEYGCVPLAPRALRIPNRRQALTATLILATTVAVAALGLLPAAIAFALGVLACLAFRVVSPRNVYEAVDWPVIVLLGALIPVAGAMASTGTADLIARVLLDHLARGHPLLAVTLILVVAMTLSDFMNNAATAAVMCPVAISAAARLEARPDAFLMAVAIGASCAFHTPIGHQNNTLILGPGGFHFGDYWRLGLPLELLIIGLSIPLLWLVWPL